jgi:hypothetical protein
MFYPHIVARSIIPNYFFLFGFAIEPSVRAKLIRESSASDWHALVEMVAVMAKYIRSLRRQE